MPATKTKTFAEAYADAVIPDMTDEQFETASEVRELTWRGKRMSLKAAAELYATIVDGYNAFLPNMLTDLLAEFPDAGIEATPAREYSVAVYLWIAESFEDRVENWITEHFHADSINFRDDGSLRIFWD